MASLEEGSGRLGRQLNTIYADLADNLSRVTKSTEKQKSSCPNEQQICENKCNF